jgi:hypothetical protein
MKDFRFYIAVESFNLSPPESEFHDAEKNL